MVRKRMKIVDADVQFVSLCPRGKNRMAVLYKEEDGTVEFQTLVKDDLLDEQGQLTAIVYAPGLEDADGHFADKDGIARMCRSFMRNGAKVDVRHNEIALKKEDVYVTECFLAKGNDPEFAGTKDLQGRVVDMDGAWVTRYQIDNEQLRKAYREGKWNGVSLFGPGRLEVVSKEEDQGDTESILKALAERLRATTNLEEEEIDMKKEELLDALAEHTKAQNAELVKSLVTELKPLLKGEQTGTPPKPADGSTPPEATAVEFEGDRANPEDIKKHLRKVKLAGLQKGVDWNDPASVEAYEEALSKELSNKPNDNDDPSESSEVKALRKQLEKALSSSTQSGNGNGKGTGKYAHLSKEDAEIAEAADAAAAYVNGETAKS